jgi:hypothetical protein
MPARTNRGVATTILGVIFIAGGVFLISHPTAGLVLHQDAESGSYSGEWVSTEGSRAYGAVAVLLGAGLVWVGRWPRWGKRRTAIDDYVWSLSQELSQRLGMKNHYSVDEVSRIVRESRYRIAYLAYAHAMFCSRSAFDAYYGPLHVACTYDGLRDVIARRYLHGARGFDAADIVRLATPPKERECSFSEHVG